MEHKENTYQTIRFRCDDKKYESWNIYNASSLGLLDKESYCINPITHKLFNQDTFRYYNDNTLEIIYSSVRNMPIIPGVIMLDKYYGTYKDKFLYMFNPDDKRIPSFVVPYKKKYIGFSKVNINKFATIKFIHWDFKHPFGQLIQTIGDVNVLENFYEYQLYCKSLNASIQNFTKAAIESLRDTSELQYIKRITDKYPDIEDRTDEYIISIDPRNTRDLDDAFSCIKTDFNGKEVYRISIYIANVAIWLESLDIWNSFSTRISTIYLPDRKRPMMPSIISDGLCSLTKDTTRFAFTLDIYIKEETQESGETKMNIIHNEFKNTMIKVSQNYSYETETLKQDLMYNQALYVISKLSKIVKYIDSVTNSYDLVAYIMTFMNYMTARKLIEYDCGIFRSAKINSSFVSQIPEELPKKMKNLLINWNSTGGFYTCVNEDTPQELKNELFNNELKHDILKVDAYIHITSPIRRLVDLLNLITIQSKLGLFTMSENATKFYNKWTTIDSIEYINTSMRAIRKLQGDCEILQLCNNKPEILNKTYKGYVFDRIKRTDGLYQYVVYIQELYMIHRHTTRHYFENYTYHDYKLYLFNNEFSFKKKILLGYME